MESSPSSADIIRRQTAACVVPPVKVYIVGGGWKNPIAKLLLLDTDNPRALEQVRVVLTLYKSRMSSSLVRRQSDWNHEVSQFSCLLWIWWAGLNVGQIRCLLLDCCSGWGYTRSHNSTAEWELVWVRLTASNEIKTEESVCIQTRFWTTRKVQAKTTTTEWL